MSCLHNNYTYARLYVTPKTTNQFDRAIYVTLGDLFDTKLALAYG